MLFPSKWLIDAMYVQFKCSPSYIRGLNTEICYLSAVILDPKHKIYQYPVNKQYSWMQL